MDSTCKTSYKKIGEGIAELSDKIEINSIRMPIGFGGAVANHFLQYIFEKKNLKDIYSNFDLTVQMSSKTGEFDSEKFGKVLDYVHATNSQLYAIDMRTKTGALVEMFKEKTYDWKNKNQRSFNINKVEFGAVFDPLKKADIRGSALELTDEEWELLNFVDKPTYEKLIRKENGTWHYNLTPEIIGEFNHIPEIRKEIDSLI